MELHELIGPAGTTVSAIAERAGVQRATVYRHFPDERSLFAACSAHWATLHPAPDPSTWENVADPPERLALALDALYAWYEDVEPMLTNVVRDMDRHAPVAEVAARRIERLGVIQDGLARGWAVPGAAGRRLRAALGLALDFTTWQGMHARGLSRTESVELMCGMVAAATTTS